MCTAETVSFRTESQFMNEISAWNVSRFIELQINICSKWPEIDANITQFCHLLAKLKL